MYKASWPVPSAVPPADAQGAVSGAVGSPHHHRVRTHRSPSPVPSAVPPVDAQGAVSGAVGSPHQHRDRRHREPWSVTLALCDADKEAGSLRLCCGKAAWRTHSVRVPLRANERRSFVPCVRGVIFPSWNSCLSMYLHCRFANDVFNWRCCVNRISARQRTRLL